MNILKLFLSETTDHLTGILVGMFFE
jgi:hypothetical protein